MAVVSWNMRSVGWARAEDIIGEDLTMEGEPQLLAIQEVDIATDNEVPTDVAAHKGYK